MEQDRGIPYALPQLTKEDADAIYDRFSAQLAADRVAPDAIPYECTETVFNRTASLEDVRAHLRSLPLRETLELLGTIGVEIARGRRPIDAVLQVQVALRLSDGSPPVAALLDRLINTPERALVDEEQIGVLSAIALQFCAGAAWTADSRLHLLGALLGFHSVKTAELHGDDVDAYAAFRRIELRATSTDPEKVTDVMGRWFAFFEWSRSEKGRASRNYVDLDQLCENALDITYTDWAAAAFCLSVPFTIIQTAPNSRRFDAFIDPAVTLGCFTHPEKLARFLQMTSIAREDLKEKLEGISTTSLSELELLIDRPLVSTAYGTCCPVPRFLPAVAGSALIFRFGAWLDANGGSSLRLRAFWGEFLEAYVLDLLSSATKDGDRRIFPEKCYGTPQKKSSDVSLFAGKNAVFVDVTATRFRLRDSVVGLDEAAAEEDLERFIIHKVRDEIARCAREFRSGELVFDEIDPNNIERIYGLAISPQNVPRLIGLSEALDRLMPVVPEDLAEWDFFDLNEIEFFPEIYKGKLDLAGMIAAKKADPFGKPRSLTNYLYFTYPGLFRVEGDPADRPPSPWFLAIMAKAKEWGMKGS